MTTPIFSSWEIQRHVEGGSEACRASALESTVSGELIKLHGHKSLHSELPKIKRAMARGGLV